MKLFTSLPARKDGTLIVRLKGATYVFEGKPLTCEVENEAHAEHLRAGNFQTDQAGYVTNPQGARLQVFAPNADGTNFDAGRLTDLPLARGLVRLGEAFAVLPAVRRKRELVFEEEDA